MIQDSDNPNQLPYYRGKSRQALQRVIKMRLDIQHSASAYVDGFASIQDAATELSKCSKLPISPALLWKVVNGKCDSDRVRQALNLLKDPRIRIRPECNITEAREILKAIAGIPALADYSKRLRRQVTKVEP